MMTMINKTALSFMIAATMVLATSAWAQEKATDRDPFDSSELGAPTQAPAPKGKAWGRDPFSNPLAVRGPVRRKRGPEARGKGLTGIIYSQNLRLAIVNGETVGEGGSIGDKKLVSIGERSVKLENAAGVSEEIFLRDFSMRK